MTMFNDCVVLTCSSDETALLQRAERRPAAVVRRRNAGARLLQAALLLTLGLVCAAQSPVEFSSNEDKRNNFEREFLSFGKRAVAAAAPADLMERHFMSFGKRADDFGRQFMPFGKRYMSLADVLSPGGASAAGGGSGGAFGAPVIGVYERAPLLEKRAPDVDFQRDFMAFGRRRK